MEHMENTQKKYTLKWGKTNTKKPLKSPAPNLGLVKLNHQILRFDSSNCRSKAAGNGMETSIYFQGMQRSD